MVGQMEIVKHSFWVVALKKQTNLGCFILQHGGGGGSKYTGWSARGSFTNVGGSIKEFGMTTESQKQQRFGVWLVLPGPGSESIL